MKYCQIYGVRRGFENNSPWGLLLSPLTKYLTLLISSSLVGNLKKYRNTVNSVNLYIGLILKYIYRKREWEES